MPNVYSTAAMALVIGVAACVHESTPTVTASNVPMVAIPVADASCDVTIKPASKVYRLHIKPALFNNLQNGQIWSSGQFAMDVTAPGRVVAGGFTLDDDSATVTHTFSQPPMAAVTQMDIDLRSQWTNNLPILVKIILEDPSLTFIAGNTPTDPSNAATTDQATLNQSGMFTCLQPILHQKAGQSSVAFRVNHIPTPGSFGILNIGITVRDLTHFSLPIVLDPKVPNNG